MHVDPNDQRYFRDDDGNYRGMTSHGWDDLDRQRSAGSGAEPSSPFPYIMLAIGCVLTFLDKLSRTLPWWLLAVITLAVSLSVGALVGRRVRNSLGRDCWVVWVSRLLSFAAVGIFFGSFFYQPNGLGTRMLWIYTFIGAGLFALFFLIGLIMEHPIRGTVLVLVVSWLVWTFFSPKPPQTPSKTEPMIASRPAPSGKQTQTRTRPVVGYGPRKVSAPPSPH